MATAQPKANRSRNVREAVNDARRVAANGHAPYSNFFVGCVAETSEGETFVGANMENAAYGVGMCAEVGALTAATAAGALGRIVRVTVAGGELTEGRLGGSAVVTPCGRCRQLILEAAHVGGHDIEVVSSSGDGGTVEKHSIAELLPLSFGPSILIPG